MVLGVLTVVVVLGGALVAFVLMSGGKKSPDTRDVADQFFKADVAHDIGAMQKLACGAIFERLKHPSASGGFNYDRAYTISDIRPDPRRSDMMLVSVNITRQSGSQGDFTAYASKQSGQWQMCDVQTGDPIDQDKYDAQEKQTLQRVLQAHQNGDDATVDSFTCEPLHSKVKDLPPMPNFDIRVPLLSHDDGQLWADEQFLFNTSAKAGGETDGRIATMQLNGGTWKVCDIRSD
jgi:hypothetical protein